MSEEQKPQGYRVIGKVEDFTSFPAPVTIDYDPYYIVKDESVEGEPSFRLICGICPHAGGIVSVHGDEFICPLHYWMFDIQTGESTNMPGAALDCQPLEVIDGQYLLKQA